MCNLKGDKISGANLLGAMESNSSKKSTQGLAALARSKRSRTFRKSINETSMAGGNATCRLFTRADVFVEKLWTFDTYKVQTALFRNSRCQKSLPTTWKAIEKQTEDSSDKLEVG
jgi:hypothetical protein